MDCRDAARFVQLRLDDEIEPVDCIQLDRHLETCPHCRSTVDAEVRVRSEVRAKLRAVEPHAPAELAARIVALSRAEERAGGFSVGRASAACVAIAMVGALSWSASSPQDRLLLDETVTRHSRNLPPEIRADLVAPEEVDRFLERNLRYPVTVPRFAGPLPAKLVGARLSSIRDRDAAYMIYDHRGARLSLFAYPRAEAANGPEGFERRQLGDRVLYVGRRRGYNVVSWQDRNLEYSLVSDVDPGELINFVSTTGR